MIFGRTGEQCAITGRYRCFGNYEVQVSLRKGDLFPQTGESSNAFWVLSGKLEEDPGRNPRRYKERPRS